MEKVKERKPGKFALFCEGPSRTKQAFKDACDINHIVKKFMKDGLISHVNSRQGMYADISSVVDYQKAQNLVLKANRLFSELPSELRDRFKNEPQNFLQFMSDPKNKGAAIEMGLLPAEKPAEPRPGPTAPDPPPKVASPEGEPAKQVPKK